MSKASKTPPLNILTLTTVNTTGKWSTKSKQGSVYATVIDKFSAHSQQVAVQVMDKIEGVETRRETALWNIWEDEAPLFAGTFEQLKANFEAMEIMKEFLSKMNEHQHTESKIHAGFTLAANLPAFADLMNRATSLLLTKVD